MQSISSRSSVDLKIDLCSEGTLQWRAPHQQTKTILIFPVGLGADEKCRKLCAWTACAGFLNMGFGMKSTVLSQADKFENVIADGEGYA